MRIQTARFILAAALPATLLLGLTAPGRAMPAEIPGYGAYSALCHQTISRTERELKLPVGIMQAISLAESGRWDKASQSHFAWPWTVMALGKGRFYPSKAAAIAAVRELQADGVKNIDVGCMQVNLKYHPDAFESLEEAFDPTVNALYAAQLFAKLRVTTRSIHRAVAHYHSTTREHNIPYTRKVMRLWNEQRQRIFAAERERKLAAWRAVREQRKAERLAARNAATVASTGPR
jgi:hypothetical protein